MLRQIVKYPECASVELMKSIPSGSIIRLKELTIFRAEDGRYIIFDNSGKSILLYRCEALNTLFPHSGHYPVPSDFHVRIEQINENDMFSWARYVTEVHYHELKPRGCNCGSSYTSFPNHHSIWCDTNIWE